MTARFRRRYGAGPGHLAASLVGLAISVYGLVRIAQHPGAPRVLVYLFGAIVVHDLVLLPLYTALYAAVWRIGHVDRDPARRVPIVRHLLVPAVVSGVLFALWFPLILGLPDTGHIHPGGVGDVAGRFALITAVLFGGSALAYAVRAARVRGWPTQDAPAGN